MSQDFHAAAGPDIPFGTGIFRVARIFCVGRNYAAHAAEMGNEVDRTAPFYFTKSPVHARLSGAELPYPPGTADLHHEVEYVLALGNGGQIVGSGVGLDMTRRDLQAEAKAKGRPWDTAKDFEGSAIFGPLRPGEATPGARIRLSVNGETRQEAPLSDMVWSPAEIVAHLATLYTLGPGDLVMTGTPAGVGPVVAGDVLLGEVDGCDPVTLTITDPVRRPDGS